MDISRRALNGSMCGSFYSDCSLLSEPTLQSSVDVDVDSTSTKRSSLHDDSTQSMESELFAGTASSSVHQGQLAQVLETHILQQASLASMPSCYSDGSTSTIQCTAAMTTTTPTAVHRTVRWQPNITLHETTPLHREPNNPESAVVLLQKTTTQSPQTMPTSARMEEYQRLQQQVLDARMSVQARRQTVDYLQQQVKTMKEQQQQQLAEQQQEC
jgi:hypothetical protein